MANTITVLIPTAEPKIKKLSASSRVDDLNGKVVGFLWNGKPNGDILLERLREQLSQKFKLADSKWRQVEALHNLAEDTPDVEQLATITNTVVIAVGD